MVFGPSEFISCIRAWRNFTPESIASWASIKFRQFLCPFFSGMRATIYYFSLGIGSCASTATILAIPMALTGAHRCPIPKFNTSTLFTWDDKKINWRIFSVIHKNTALTIPQDDYLFLTILTYQDDEKKIIPLGWPVWIISPSDCNGVLRNNR